MIFLTVLGGTTLMSAIVSRRAGPRAWARSGLAAALVVAGIAHLVAPTPFEQHLPNWVPVPLALVVLTGLVEVALGIALVVARGQVRLIGLITAAYLVAVWPANIYVAVAGVEVDGQPGGVYPWLRLPLQLLFILWAWWSTQPPASSPSTVTTTLPRAWP